MNFRRGGRSGGGSSRYRGFSDGPPKDYFDEDDDDDDDDYRGSRNSRQADASGGGGGDDDEVDPLDAFMAGIDSEIKQSKPKQEKRQAIRAEFEEDAEEDAMESFVRARQVEGGSDAGAAAARAYAAGGDDSDEEVYRTAAAIDAATKGRDLEAPARDPGGLVPVNHDTIQYPSFFSIFHEENNAAAGRDEAAVVQLRDALGLKVGGFDVLAPIQEFSQLRKLPARVLAIMQNHKIDKPTPVQAQAMPVAMNGRDVLALAKTGSGKTLGYLLPMLTQVHFNLKGKNRMDKSSNGPMGLILTPTRELSMQVYTETRRYAKGFGDAEIRVSAVVGGMEKYTQIKELKAGAEVVIATPGRLIDLIRAKATTLQQVTMLVLDEADRMLDLGFEQQVRSICNNVRPDRQTLLFSATMPRKVESFIEEIMPGDEVKITVGRAGERGAVNEDVRQHTHIMKDDEEKLVWLLRELPGMIDEGDVLIFGSTRARVEEVTTMIAQCGFKTDCLHGDKVQADRERVLKELKSGVLHCVVATDVASRGLDIGTVKTVVSLDAPRDIETHVHRVGRTGRAGARDGVAHISLLQSDYRFAAHLVRSLIRATQPVPRPLMSLAQQDPKFTLRRSGKQKGPGGAGIGFGGGGVNSAQASATRPRPPAPQQQQQQRAAPRGPSFVPAQNQAMRSSFMSQFKSGGTLGSTFVPSSSAQPPAREEQSAPRAKRSRWDT